MIVTNVWTRAQFETLFKPLVYYLEKNDGEILYIGSSKIGLARLLQVTPSNPKGEAARRSKAFEQAERIRVLVFDDEREARIYERNEIAAHAPIFNTNGTAHGPLYRQPRGGGPKYYESW